MGVCLRGCLGSSGVVGLGICQVAIGYRDRWIKTGRESWVWGWAPSSAESGHLVRGCGTGGRVSRGTRGWVRDRSQVGLSGWG